MGEAARPSRTARIIAALDRAAHRPGFLPAVSFFPIADYVLWFLPIQMLLATLSVLQPRRWAVFATTFVLASALGALLTAWAVQALGPWLLDTLLGGVPDEAEGIVATIEQYGLPALVLLAALPWPPRATVIVCALAELSPAAIGLGVAAGRILPSFGVAWIGARAPHLLRRLAMVDRVLTEVEGLRRTAAP
jgi:hypothetical protein